MDIYPYLVAINPRAAWHGLLVLLFAALAALAIRLFRHRSGSTPLTKMTGYGIAVLLLLIVVQLGIAGSYFFNPSYLDHAEPAVVAVSWLGWRSNPLYPHLATGDIYGMLYGPVIFQAGGFLLWLFGPSIVASKIPGIIAFIAAPILSFAVLRRHGATVAAALAIAAVQSLVQSGFGDQAYAFGVRADPFLFLIGVVAVAAAASGPTARNAAVLGLLGALAMNLKIHGALYVLPMFAYCVFRAETAAARLRLSVIAAATGVVAVALPFLPQNVSLAEYSNYFRLASHHRIDRWIFEKNVVFGAMCLAPALWIYAFFVPKLPRGFLWFTAAALASMALAAVMGAKEGSGPHHLLPFVPSCAWAFFVLRRAAWGGVANAAGGTRFAASSLGLILAFLVGYTPILMISWSRELRNFASLPLHRAALTEIDEALAGNPGLRLAVGPGTNPRFDPNFDPTFFLVIPVLRGNPLPLGSNAWMDFAHGGESDDSVQRVLRECRVDIWLLPAGAPLNTANFYTGKALFSDAVLADFRASYELQGSGNVFDRWRCKKAT